MFFHILKRDLKRKKTMNMILLIFITMATMFLASSANNLVTVSGAVDYFMHISDVPDYFTIALWEGEDNSIKKFIEENKHVTEYEIESGFNILNDQIAITQCEKEPERKEYKKTNTLFVQRLPKKFMKIFPEEGEEVILKSGQVAIPKLEADSNHLQVGDKISLKMGEVEQEFEIAEIVKDAVFGTSYMGFKRIFITDEDFAKFESQDNLIYTNIYSANCTDAQAFKQQLGEANFAVISIVDKETVSMCYVMDMLVAAVFVVVSVCLILIAFLVLRFTIVFTLQEDYKEIGIMKAIGVKDRGIKGLYLVKYLSLSIVGGAIGFVCSFPFGNMLLKNTIVNIKVDKMGQNYWMNLLCMLFIIGIVLLFCYSSTNNLKKYSAMDAIRSGSNGERFKAKNHLKLWKRKRMKPCMYMAVNDILSSMKRFAILAVTFCLGTVMILLPLSAANTLKDDSIVELFSMAQSDVYIDNKKVEEYVADKDIDRFLADMDEMEEELYKHGIEAVTGSDLGYVIPCYGTDAEERYSYYILQEVGNWERTYKLLEGKEPELSNEVIITDITAKEMGVEIGDSIFFEMNGKEEEFIITGTYQSMMNMGKGFRVSRSARLDKEYFSGIFALQAEVKDMEAEEAYEKIKEIFPEYDVYDSQGMAGKFVGSILEQLDMSMFCIVAVVVVINCLITILMMKTIMTKERGDIALLKSVGFASRSVKAWQVTRILIVLLVAIVVGTILSNLTAPFTMGAIFAMMGANKVELVMNPLEAYVIYPLVLLVATGVSAYFCAGGIKKVDLREVNTME